MTKMNGNEPRTTLEPKEARQGRRGVQVLVVLVAGIALALVAWWAVEIYGGAIEPAAESQVGNPETVDPAQPGDADID